MYTIEVKEEKDAPTRKEVDPEKRMIGKAACLHLHLTKALYTTYKVVILDSGFVSSKPSLLCKRWDYLPEP